MQERPLSAVATTENRAAGMAWSAHRVEAEDVDTELFNPVDVGNWGGSEEVWGADRRGSQLEPVRRADE